MKLVSLDLEWLKTVDQLPSRNGDHTEFDPIAKARIKDDRCPVCDKPKTEWTRRTDWRCCSVECTSKFWFNFVKANSVPILNCFKRDNWTCVECGWNEKMQKKLPGKYPLEWNVDNCLECDHIRPIAIGGEEFDLDNIQTLCYDCHKIKTKHDIKEIAKARRILKSWKVSVIGGLNGL